MANTFIYREEWAKRLQDRLAEPNKFRDIADVRLTNIKTLNNPYASDPAVVTPANRDTAYTFSNFTETNETLVVNQYSLVPVFIDEADLAQSDFLTQMGLADRQAQQLNETVENALYGNHANFTNLGVGDITSGSAADTTQITVTVNNIDDIIVNMLRLIGAAKGDVLLGRNGGFIVWRYADFMLLRQLAFANGYMTADSALRGGVPSLGGFDYMGVTHYASTQLTANHVFGGVKRTSTVGLLKDTYGKLKINDQDPGLKSGVGVITRIDYGVKTWTPTVGLQYDINVA